MRTWVHRLTQKDIENKTAICDYCGPVTIQNKGTWRCANAIRAIKRKVSSEDYGVPPNNCEVCGDKGRICWDHDHKTGKFRGWLCDKCNITLGQARDDPVLLRKLADYLEK